MFAAAFHMEIPTVCSSSENVYHTQILQRNCLQSWSSSNYESLKIQRELCFHNLHPFSLDVKEQCGPSKLGNIFKVNMSCNMSLL